MISWEQSHGEFAVVPDKETRSVTCQFAELTVIMEQSSKDCA